MSILLVIVLVLLLFGGGWGYRRGAVAYHDPFGIRIDLAIRYRDIWFGWLSISSTVKETKQCHRGSIVSVKNGLQLV